MSLAGVVSPADGAPPLVALEDATDSSEPVQVAGVVDRSSVADGSFVVEGPRGARLEVLTSGKLPAGFDVAPVVVLVGQAREGRFEASQVLVPGAARTSAAGRGLKAVAAVTMAVWIGLFAYVLRLHRKLGRLEGS